MDARKLKTLARVMAEQGVKCLKFEGVEIVMDERFMAPTVEAEAQAEPEAPSSKYTDEDALFWSAPGMEN